MRICTFEKNVILSAAGLPQIGPENEHVTGWGAAVGAALGPLTRAGYLRRDMATGVMTLTATPEGIAAAQADD